MENAIVVEVWINESVGKVWDCWTNPKHITGWNFASDDWCCPKAENKLKVGGKFSYRMESKDGEIGFDFEGIFIGISEKNKIQYLLGDGRKVAVTFEQVGEQTSVVESFEAENENSRELQQSGWQAILNNFKKYTESVI
jgi:uncharacterized protein YndB with AHSA1/START domain